jgi:hypothetical protein
VDEKRGEMVEGESETRRDAFQHNLRREFGNPGEFFIPIGRNPLKSPDSEK